MDNPLEQLLRFDGNFRCFSASKGGKTDLLSYIRSSPIIKGKGFVDRIHISLQGITTVTGLMQQIGIAIGGRAGNNYAQVMDYLRSINHQTLLLFDNVSEMGVITCLKHIAEQNTNLTIVVATNIVDLAPEIPKTLISEVVGEYLLDKHSKEIARSWGRDYAEIKIILFGLCGHHPYLLNQFKKAIDSVTGSDMFVAISTAIDTVKQNYGRTWYRNNPQTLGSTQSDIFNLYVSSSNGKITKQDVMNRLSELSNLSPSMYLVTVAYGEGGKLEPLPTLLGSITDSKTIKECFHERLCYPMSRIKDNIKNYDEFEQHIHASYPDKANSHLVVHLSLHGRKQDGDIYISFPDDTVVAGESLLATIFNSGFKGFLIILDLCYAGEIRVPEYMNPDPAKPYMLLMSVYNTSAYEVSNGEIAVGLFIPCFIEAIQKYIEGTHRNVRAYTETRYEQEKDTYSNALADIAELQLNQRSNLSTDGLIFGYYFEGEQIKPISIL